MATERSILFWGIESGGAGCWGCGLLGARGTDRWELVGVGGRGEAGGALGIEPTSFFVVGGERSACCCQRGVFAIVRYKKDTGESPTPPRSSARGGGTL
ncbi:MAG: hypothetical protein LBQ31_10770 [Bacteroidales bacterium]|nr:hypothetical protein [Bacteroidales bacterium]